MSWMADTMSAPLVPFSVRVYFNSRSDIRGRRRRVFSVSEPEGGSDADAVNLVTQQQDELFGIWLLKRHHYSIRTSNFWTLSV